MKRRKASAPRPQAPRRSVESPLRITGGTLRGRKVPYSGLTLTRPMKERLRQTVFDLLGRTVEGTHAIDLFAGTGALGFEALSRGAFAATFIERHAPTAELIRQNARELGLAERAHVVTADTFTWLGRQDGLPAAPWLVFCSPPFEFYESRHADLLALLGRLIQQSPPESAFVVEADRRFDVASLHRAEEWDVRQYGGITLAVWYHPASP
jgi:16S rRNA (guanine966-N2)-methyltransferase